jgi:hypothetical protein
VKLSTQKLCALFMIVIKPSPICIIILGLRKFWFLSNETEKRWGHIALYRKVKREATGNWKKKFHKRHQNGESTCEYAVAFRMLDVTTKSCKAANLKFSGIFRSIQVNGGTVYQLEQCHRLPYPLLFVIYKYELQSESP